MRRAAVLSVLIVLWVSTSHRTATAQPPVTVIDAPSLAVVVRQALAWLPPEESARVRVVAFVPPVALANAGRCGEAYPDTGTIWLSSDARCLVFLYDLLLWEVGRTSLDCRALWEAWDVLGATRCVDAYRLSRRISWP